MSQLAAFNLSQWIEEHRELLRPPVGNARILPEGDFIVMAIGGPNLRTDYHDDPGEEIFFQLEGDMTLRVMEESGPRDIPIREGEIFLLPGRVRHSPQRPANTVGMVVERMEFEVAAALRGVPHVSGTKEYLTSLKGSVSVTVANQTFVLEEGDVLAFPGDQAHLYRNVGNKRATCISVVTIAPVGAR